MRFTNDGLYLYFGKEATVDQSSTLLSFTKNIIAMTSETNIRVNWTPLREKEMCQSKISRNNFVILSVPNHLFLDCMNVSNVSSGQSTSSTSCWKA